jgi:hypothetical protein
MKKIVLLALLLFPVLASAQTIPAGYIQATATVPILANGSFGAAWTNLSSSPQLGLLGCVSTFQTTVNGTIDSYGKFSVLLADPRQICPSPSTWTFTFSCYKPPGAFITQITVTGAGSVDDISAQILAAAPANICAGGGGGGGPTIETNSVNNLSQTLLNFTNTSTISFLNPSGGVETATCSTATNSAIGCLRPDGTTCTVTAGVLTCPGGGSGGNTTNFEHNDTLLTGLFPPNSGIQVFDVNDVLPAAPAAVLGTNTNCTWQADPSTGRVSCYVPNGASTLVNGPGSGNHVFVPFTVATPFQSSGGASSIAYTTTTATITVFANSSGFPPSSNDVAYTVPAALPSYINPANITAVYAVIWQGNSFGGANVYTVCNGSTVTAAGSGVNPFYVLLGTSSSVISGSNCTFNAGGSGPRTQLTGYLNLVGLEIYYNTGSPAPPPQTAIQVEYPLDIDPVTGAIGISPLYPNYLNPVSIASLPLPQNAVGEQWVIGDGVSLSDCTTGGGIYTVVCLSQGYNGGWTPVSENGLSGMTTGQVPIAATATTVTSSKALAGGGAGITTGPTTSVNSDCVQFTGTAGQISDSGSPCGGGGGSGYNNVVASSTADTTVAAINGKCSAGQTYWASVPITFTAGGTIGSGCNVMFVKGGVWSGSVSITFANPIRENDGPSEHFSGPTITLASQDARPEWWGAVADWNGTTGTDNTTALNATEAALTNGVVLGQPGCYKVTGTFTINKSNTGFIGESLQAIGYGGSVAPTCIISTSASATPVSILGTSLSNAINGVQLKAVDVKRSTAPSGSAIGVSIAYAAWSVIDQVWSEDSNTDFDISQSPNARITNSTADWCFGSVTGYTGTLQGWRFENAAASLDSVNMDSNRALLPSPHACGTSGSIYGAYVNGTFPNTDLVSDHFETAYLDYGIYSTNVGTDMHWTHYTLDNCQYACIYQNLGSGPITYEEGWGRYSGTSSVGANIHGSTYTSLLNSQFYTTVGTATAGIELNGNYLTATGNLVVATSGDAIDPTSTYGSTISSNALSLNTGTGVKCIGCGGNSIGGNSASGASGATGYSFDSTSTNNVGLNSCSTNFAPGTCINDLGTGDQLKVGTQTICTGTIALRTTAIGSGANDPAGPATATCTGLLTTDNIQLDFNGNPTGITGFTPGTAGTLTIFKWPTANTINVLYQNNTGGTITPGAVTLNYRVVR